METELELYHVDTLALTGEKESFIAGFIRLSTDGGKRNSSEVAHYVEVVYGIRNFENLNTQVLWTAFVALSRLEKRDRSLLLHNYAKINKFLYNPDVQDLVDNITRVKYEDKLTEGQFLNLKQKMTTQLYSYTRLILTSDNQL